MSNEEPAKRRKTSAEPPSFSLDAVLSKMGGSKDTTKDTTKSSSSSASSTASTASKPSGESKSTNHSGASSNSTAKTPEIKRDDRSHNSDIRGNSGHYYQDDRRPFFAYDYSPPPIPPMHYNDMRAYPTYNYNSYGYMPPAFGRGYYNYERNQSYPPYSGGGYYDPRPSQEDLSIWDVDLWKSFLLRGLQDYQIILSGKEKPNISLEIEARLGFFDSRDTFHPGTSSERFNEFQKRLDYTYNVTTSHIIDYIYPEENGERLRIEFNPDTGKIESGRDKQKITQANCFRDRKTLNDFDIRLGMATENPSDKVPHEVKPGYIMSREKTRRSYANEDDDWIIDLTSVKTTDTNTNKVTTTYEIEIELKQSTLQNWLGSEEDKEQDERLILNLWHKFTALDNRISEFPSIFMGRIVPIEDRLQYLLLSYFGEEYRPDSANSFPGTLPISFTRSTFKTVKQGSYWLSEKTNGVRYLMLILSDSVDKGVYLIDRKFSFSIIHGMNYLTAASKGVTILDGELVHNKGSEIPSFLIFDGICFNNEVVLSEKFSSRLKRVQKFVGELKQPERKPIELIDKLFFKKEQTQELIECIIEENGDHYFKDKDGKHYHKSDGIIFIPDAPYGKRGADKNMFKWKYPSHLTVDFKLIKRSGRNSALACEGPKSSIVEVSDACFSAGDQARLDEDLRKFHGKDRDPILECGYDTKTGCWVYHNLRPDKEKANNPRTMTETLLALAENIAIEEIKSLMESPN